MTTSSTINTRRHWLIAGIAFAVSSGLQAQTAQLPIRVGGSLPLTGALASVGQIHKISAEVFIDNLNKRGGLLGRKVEYVVIDDQSQPANTRNIYEKLITADKVDLIMGPYGTSAIIAAMGVAQRFNKIFIQSSLGDPALAVYDLQFPALPIGATPKTTDTEVVLDAYTSLPKPPKTIAFVTSKFPSARDLAQGGQEVANKRGMNTVLFLEYEFGTRDFGSIAARIKDANPDVLWSGAIGMEASQLLDAMKRIDYTPKNHFYLFPAPGPTAANASASGITSLTWFEEHEPFVKNPGAADLISGFNQRAKEAGLPYPVTEYQAASEYAAWQMLEAAVKGVGRLDDKAMAVWLKANKVPTVFGTRSFEGPFNAGPADTMLKQVQAGKWVTVWPAKYRPAGTSMISQ